jgi:hypothetical protein
MPNLQKKAGSSEMRNPLLVFPIGGVLFYVVHFNRKAIGTATRTATAFP